MRVPATNSRPSATAPKIARGAQIGLLEQQPHHQAGHQQRRQEADREHAHLLGLAGEQVRPGRRTARTWPARSAGTTAGPARNQRIAPPAREPIFSTAASSAEADEQQRVGELAVDRVVDAHRERQRAQPDDRVDDLALEEVGRVAVLLGGEHRARREHHHHAERGQRQHRADAARGRRPTSLGRIGRPRGVVAAHPRRARR